MAYKQKQKYTKEDNLRFLDSVFITNDKEILKKKRELERKLKLKIKRK